jgi:hypothetical protein
MPSKACVTQSHEDMVSDAYPTSVQRLLVKEK